MFDLTNANEAVDILPLCKWIDTMFRQNDFSIVDDFISSQKYQEITTLGIVAIFRYSYKCRDLLPSWKPMLIKAYDIVKEREPDRVKNIFHGLL